MILHLLEVWLVLAVAFVAGCSIGWLLYRWLEQTDYAFEQQELAASVRRRMDRLSGFGQATAPSEGASGTTSREAERAALVEAYRRKALDAAQHRKVAAGEATAGATTSLRQRIHASRLARRWAASRSGSPPLAGALTGDMVAAAEAAGPGTAVEPGPARMIAAAPAFAEERTPVALPEPLPLGPEPAGLEPDALEPDADPDFLLAELPEDEDWFRLLGEDVDAGPLFAGEEELAEDGAPDAADLPAQIPEEEAPRGGIPPEPVEMARMAEVEARMAEVEGEGADGLSDLEFATLAGVLARLHGAAPEDGEELADALVETDVVQPEEDAAEDIHEESVEADAPDAYHLDQDPPVEEDSPRQEDFGRATLEADAPEVDTPEEYPLEENTPEEEDLGPAPLAAAPLGIPEWGEPVLPALPEPPGGSAQLAAFEMADHPRPPVSFRPVPDAIWVSEDDLSREVAAGTDLSSVERVVNSEAPAEYPPPAPLAAGPVIAALTEAALTDISPASARWWVEPPPDRLFRLTPRALDSVPDRDLIGPPAERPALPTSDAVGPQLPVAGARRRAGRKAATGAGRRQPQGARPPAALPGEAAEDLTRIRGIGRANQAKLHEIGVRRLAQIAAWSEDEQRWVSAYLGFVGRVEREGWAGQARALTTEAAEAAE